MKNFKTFLTLAVGVFSIAVLQSCSDDDEGNQPETITYPHSIAFSTITDHEFMMWTNGAEVSTAGLSLENYIDSADFYDLSAASFEADGSLTFTADSLFANTEIGYIGFPYIITQDSVFAVTSYVWGTDTIVNNTYVGFGGPEGLVRNQGYLQYVNTDQNGSSTMSILQDGHYTLSVALEELGLSSVGEIEEGDTLIIVNQDVHFY